MNTLLKVLLGLTVLSYLSFSPNQIKAQNSQSVNESLIKAQELLNDRKPEDALVLLKTQINSDDYHQRVKSLRFSGIAHWMNQDFDQAEKTLTESLALSRKIFDQVEEAESLYYLARIGTSTGNFEEAKAKLREAALIARNIGDKHLEFKIMNIMTWTYYATDESFYTILNQESDVYHLSNQVGTDLQKASVYNNLGYDLTVAGTVPIDSTISLMKFANKTYAEAEGHQGRWYTLMNLTWQHRLKEDLDNSKRYGEMSLKQALSEEDRHAIVEAAFQLGETFIEMDRIEEAGPHYETGLKWRNEEEDRDRFVFDVYYARFLWESGEQDRAVTMLESAVNWLTQSEVFYEMHGRALLASYYWEKGQIDLAAKQLDILENPRGDYISLESRCMAAIVRAKWLSKNGQPNMGKALMESWLEQTKNIGAQQLVNNIENYLNSI